MVDASFFNNYGPFSLDEIASIGQCQVILPDINIDKKAILIEGVASLNDACHNEVSFFNNTKYLDLLLKTKAGFIIVEEKYRKYIPQNIIILLSSNPYKSFALISQAFYPNNSIIPNISANVKIDNTASIGQNCRIEEMVIIGPNASIGDNCVIGNYVYIGKGVTIGDNCHIGSHVSITHTIAGNNLHIHAGTKIGEESFGFATDEKGKHITIPQLGRVIIGNDVVIGANSCIDRGSANDTIIGNNCRIHNLVEISHNVEIGDGTVIVSQVGIAGSTRIGKYTIIGGQVGIAGHLNIGNKVQIAAKSGIVQDIKDGEIVGGMPAVPIKQWHRQNIKLKKMVKGTNNEE